MTGASTQLNPVIYAQNWENARHLRSMRVLGANAFAVIAATGLATLQFVRTDAFVAILLLAFLLAVAIIQLLISLELKRELDECMQCIERQVAHAQCEAAVAMLAPANQRHTWLRLRWLYPAFYLLTVVVLACALLHRLLA